jgi:serine protease Do
VGIAPGASGSPVVNTSGEVVGLITAALSNPHTSEFALFSGQAAVMVPALPIMRMARQIVAEGHVGRAFLGVRPEPMDPNLAHALGLSHGLLVGAVSFGSPAYSAGLQSGDVILELAGRTVMHEEALRMALAEHCPGEEVTLAILRNQRMQYLKVVLGQLPEVLPSRPAVPPDPGTSNLTASMQNVAAHRPELESEIRKLEERLAELKSQVERP